MNETKKEAINMLDELYLKIKRRKANENSSNLHKSIYKKTS